MALEIKGILHLYHSTVLHLFYIYAILFRNPRDLHNKDTPKLVPITQVESHLCSSRAAQLRSPLVRRREAAPTQLRFIS